MHSNVCAYFNTSMRESACCLRIGLGPSLYFRAKPQMLSEHPVKDMFSLGMSPCMHVSHR